MLRDAPPSEDAAPEAVREGAVVGCVALAAFMFQFEAFVVNVSLPTIARELGTTTTGVSFVVVVYLLAATTALLPAGRIGDRVGLARVFVAGCVLSAIGTLGCALAPQLWLLCASRLVQGIGAGAMVAMGFAMIPAWLAPERTGRGYGYVSLGAGLGMATGLPVGGMLSDLASWRWIFVVSGPVLAVLAGVARRALPVSRRRPPPQERFDAAGAAMFAAMLIALILTLSFGDELGWRSPALVGIAAAAVALAVAIVVRTRLTGRSYLPRAALASSGFAAGLAVLFAFAMVTSGLAFLVAFSLRVVCGASSLASGLVLMAYPVSYAACGAWSGRYADRIGSRVLVIAAGLLAAVAAAAFAASLARADLRFAALYLVAFGIACGFFYAPNNRHIMARRPAGGAGEEGALLPLALNLGSMMGVVIFETAFSTMLPGGVAEVRRIFATGAAAGPPLDRAFSAAFGLAVVIPLGCALAAAFLYRPKAEA
jgi:MFS family permease